MLQGHMGKGVGQKAEDKGRAGAQDVTGVSGGRAGRRRLNSLGLCSLNDSDWLWAVGHSLVGWHLALDD